MLTLDFISGYPKKELKSTIFVTPLKRNNVK